MVGSNSGGFTLGLVCLWVGLHVLTLVTHAFVLPGGLTDRDRACGVETDGGRVDLSFLQRYDGSPRFMLEYGGWNYTFNPCIQYNLPHDPHKGLGDGCFSVLMCKWRFLPRTLQATSSGHLPAEFYTMGVIKSAQFISQHSTELARGRHHAVDESGESQHPTNNAKEEMTSGDFEGDDEEPNGHNVTRAEFDSDADSQESHDNSSMGPGGAFNMSSSASSWGVNGGLDSESTESLTEIALKLQGIRSTLDERTYIRVVCDRNRVQVDEALFKVAPSRPPTKDMHFELHHLCCCPDACSRHSVLAEHGFFPNLGKPDIHQPLQRGAQAESEELPPNGTYRLENGTYILLSESPSSSRTSDGRQHMWLVLAINLAVLTMAVIIAGLCCRKSSGTTGPYNYLPDYDKIRKEALHSSRLTLASLDSYSPPTKTTQSAAYLDYSPTVNRKTRLPVLNNCVIPGHALEVGQRLGGGLFGDTYLAEWKNRVVAAKRFTVGVHQNQLTEEDIKWIVQQILLLSKQRHKNLVAVFGICTATRQPYVVNEHVEGESLKDALRRDLPWPLKIKLCIQAADGLAFLHSHKPPVLHRDLRCANLLVDLSKDPKLKVVDYGITRLVQRLRQGCNGRKGCYCHRETSAYPASVRWTAPEILANPQAEEEEGSVFTPACDTYSYGVVMWEVATAADPYEEITDDNEVIEVVCEGYRPRWDESTSRGVLPHYVELMRVCWDQNMDNRPNFKQVAMHLKNALQLCTKLEHKSRKRNETSTTSYLMSALNI